MIDVDVIKDEIVARLKPLDLDKIILFGSYVYGNPGADSDIDLFLVKNVEKSGCNSHIRICILPGGVRFRSLY